MLIRGARTHACFLRCALYLFQSRPGQPISQGVTSFSPGLVRAGGRAQAPTLGPIKFHPPPRRQWPCRGKDGVSPSPIKIFAPAPNRKSYPEGRAPRVPNLIGNGLRVRPRPHPFSQIVNRISQIVNSAAPPERRAFARQEIRLHACRAEALAKAGRPHPHPRPKTVGMARCAVRARTAGASGRDAPSQGVPAGQPKIARPFQRRVRIINTIQVPSGRPKGHREIPADSPAGIVAQASPCIPETSEFLLLQFLPQVARPPRTQLG